MGQIDQPIVSQFLKEIREIFETVLSGDFILLEVPYETKDGLG
jgi:hypothetical protein